MTYKLELAEDSDDAALRRRMAEDVMDGRIAVTFRREPSYFDGTAIQGAGAEVIKCVDSNTRRIVGLATRATLSAYINGKESALGYLCDLRVDQSIRGGVMLARGYKMMKGLHDAAPVDLYYTMILSGNDTALNILTSGRASLPSYKAFGEVLTPAIHLDRPRRYRFSNKLRIARGTVSELGEIVRFVNEQHRRKQFAPVIHVSDVGGRRLAGLGSDDIHVAYRGEKIVGCVACWDQSHVRQIFVENLNRSLRIVRPIYNFAARHTSRKPLPRPGKRVPFFYLAWIAIENDDPTVFRELLESVYEERRNGPWHFFIAGLHASNPLAATLRHFRSIESSGQLFIVHWENGADAFERLDGRVPHIEVGAL